MVGVVDITGFWVLTPCLSVGSTDPFQKNSACTVEVEGIGSKKVWCHPTPQHAVIRIQKGVPFLITQ